ncbi:tRNA pseudouridine(38-40) synthase TruA [Stieleria sp. JC731]|uniref:tRNA pseudouridine(38-40) synthase TruA n=1 Tax=Pirellulaceae TaxID=2691357 RepID=UPI001E2FD75A|nr:tRNA pseudouridine(38-40) synthase TruA [Stieleria sp. JC731]MCC9599766.1 tRNA pseudouridine(38-40) synthase TruA [Stieleria sp. JC731]
MNDSVSRTFALVIAYDGTDYAGWQVQPDQATIQGTLQTSIRRSTGQDVTVTGSGRTDAGVHAFGQVASCRFPNWTASTEALLRAINSRLPNAIVVNEVHQADPDFHAIRDALGKRYRYQIQVRHQRNPFEHRYRWRLRRLVDVELMKIAAKKIIGHRDFSSFESAGAERKSSVRDVRDCVVLPAQDFDQTGHLAIEVEANGFLYNMVRNIVGTLVEVGLGKQPPEWIDEVLEQKNRIYAGPTAPPQGLFLKHVHYLPGYRSTITPDRHAPLTDP